MISFEVPGKAAGKARPRVTRSGQHTYAPDPGRFVERVTELGVVARQSRGMSISAAPIKLTILIDRAMPKGWSRRKRAEMDEEFAPHVPDTVNVAAAVCDALSGVFYEDDRQVVALDVRQVWAREPVTWITVEALS